QLFGQPAAQLEPEQVSYQMVIPEPRPAGVERDHKGVGVLEVKQDPFGARMACQQIAQLAVDAVEQGGAQQQLLDVGRLALQHLGERVLRYGPAAAGELRDESLWVLAVSQRDRREPQAGRPAFRMLV